MQGATEMKCVDEYVPVMSLKDALNAMKLECYQKHRGVHNTSLLIMDC